VTPLGPPGSSLALLFLLFFISSSAVLRVSAVLFSSIPEKKKKG
jgi:hypothetical protein